MYFMRKALLHRWEKHIAVDANRKAGQRMPQNVERFSDIEYILDGRKDHLLDIFYPSNTVDVLPTIIDIHGGGWVYGNKELNEYYCMLLAQFGFAVVNINYTLVPNTNLYGQIRDVFAAVHWVINNGGNYLCDVRNLFITGDSAGGQLALLANAVNNNNGFLDDFGVNSFSYGIRALGLTCPVPFLKQMFDSRDVLQKEQMKLLLRGKPGQSFLWNYADPRNYLSQSKLPPIYLLTTKGDGKYHVQSEELRNVLSALGSDFEYMEWASCENKALGHVFNVLYPEEVDGYQANKKMAEYFRTFIQE